MKLRVQNLSKSFSLNRTETHALQDVTLDVFTNEFCVIVGPSGCGKTTLLRMLAGLEEPTSGEVIYGNCNPNKPKCNLVFQEQAVFPWMTVWENIAFGLRRRGVKGAELKNIVDHFLDYNGTGRVLELLSLPAIGRNEAARRCRPSVRQRSGNFIDG